MGKIIKLKKSTISKVAAGEVISSPAAIVKELIENSIDAKASQIKINLVKGGLEKITVIDNGVGMSKTDLQICFDRYATSKIATAKDLNNIKSLGFRGEALYSIAAISLITIKSKIRSNIGGNLVEVRENILTKKSPVGMPKGTLVEVENIFFNVPARKKFFKNQQTELNKILDIVTKYALAYNNIAFSLKNNSKNILHLNNSQNFYERTEQLLGFDINREFLPVSRHENYLKIKGVLAKPQASEVSKDNQYLFINKRAVVHKKISDVIKNAYGSLIEPKAHPPFVLFLNLPYEMVDVNIHPTKKTVQLLNEDEILKIIKKTVRENLNKNNLTYKTDIFGDSLDNYFKKADKYVSQILKDSEKVWNVKLNKAQNTLDEITQIHNLYLVMQNKNGLVLIDQHAAHERILYEDFLEQFLKEKSQKNTVSADKKLLLSAKQTETLKSNLKQFESLGFKIKFENKNRFVVKKIPTIFKEYNIKALVKDTLTDLENNTVKRDILDDKSQKTLSFLACRTAIKAGDYLTQKERVNLIKRLNKTKSNYTCPHGRPVKLEISIKELAKMFKRS